MVSERKCAESGSFVAFCSTPDLNTDRQRFTRTMHSHASPRGGHGAALGAHVRRLFTFLNGQSDGTLRDKELLGGKGAGLCEMAR